MDFDTSQNLIGLYRGFQHQDIVNIWIYTEHCEHMDLQTSYTTNMLMIMTSPRSETMNFVINRGQ